MSDTLRKFLELSFDLILFMLGITILIICIVGTRDTIRAVEPENKYIEYDIS